MLMMLVMGKAAPLLGTEVKRRGRQGKRLRSEGKERTNGEEESGAAAAFLPSKGANGDAPGRAPPPPAQDDRICEDETWAGG